MCSYLMRCFLKVDKKKTILELAISKGENYSDESLFMLLVLQQQKVINELIAKVSECKKLQKETQ